MYASYFMSVLLFSQIVTDYPSGSLGDVIGQRWILAAAFSLFSIYYFLLSFANKMMEFIILAIFGGVGNALFSGALPTWLDNNYSAEIGDLDLDKRKYGFFRARVGSLSSLIAGLAIILGGILASLTSREFVFLLQSSISILFIILFLIFLKDIKYDLSDKIKVREREDRILRNFLYHLKGGLRFVLRDKTVLFFLLGTSFIYAGAQVWSQLIIYPIYFGYTGTDALAGIFRGVTFFLGIPIGIYTAKLSKEISTDRIPYFYFIFCFSFFPVFIILLTVNPLTNEFNLSGILITLLFFLIILSGVINIAEVLRQRKLIEIIDSEYRNAIYSLIPSIISILGFILFPLVGYIIEKSNLQEGIFVILVITFVGTFLVYVSFQRKLK
jgi:MFS family permease